MPIRFTTRRVTEATLFIKITLLQVPLISETLKAGTVTLLQSEVQPRQAEAGFTAPTVP